MIKLYENIRDLRKGLGWTQEDLAKKMGYTDRSMIAKIESGKVDLSQSKIIDFAKIFNIDPGDLMGWDEPESFDTPEDFEKAWNDSGGGQHPIKLTDEEYSFIIDIRARHDPNFYKRMSAYMDLFEKRGDK